MKKYTILVVDDKPDNLKTIVDYLKGSDVQYTILKATNGKIACKLAEKKIPDLIILDWKMPVMNGIETIEYLKSHKLTKDIPIIMATGVMTSAKNLKTALEAGAVDYIRKPIDKIELAARINSTLKLSDSLREIKSLNATKDKFFTLIAHDLKSPFSAMLGFLEVLIEDFNDYDTYEKKKYLNLVHQDGQKLFKLLENLLLWSLSQKGDIDFKPEKENLNSLSIETIELLSQLATNKSIILNNEIPEDIVVNVDKNMFSTIMRNLITNGIKYTPKGGEITIKARTISDENKQTHVEISVTDSGVGIPSERQSELFIISDDSTTKGTENETGTGLGLILCKEFVEKHGGKIWMESDTESSNNHRDRDEKGSSFYFTLPG